MTSEIDTSISRLIDAGMERIPANRAKLRKAAVGDAGEFLLNKLPEDRQPSSEHGFGG